MIDDDWSPPVGPTWSDEDWSDAFARGFGLCCFCDRPSDDRHFALALQIHRAWMPNAIETRYAHVQCLRRAMHDAHKLA